MPIRSFDWTAIDDDTYDQGAPIGFGATEQEAIKDLYDQVELDDDAYERAAEDAERIANAREDFDV